MSAWELIGTVDEVQLFDNGGFLDPGPVPMVNNTGEPIAIVPMNEFISFTSQVVPLPTSSLIDIGSDGIGRCRLCAYTYVVHPPWPWIDWKTGQLHARSTGGPNRATRRRNR
ncbi:hypothetical protein GS917_25150 [Rhodococcus hoagii]|uniref:hypothetical protein n=1 Tax=Rhodococcus hoagii TaxID=43767 RepID=UPI000A0F7645|nr:hypothetical protein [Prescottella equi]NKT99808.1 hypothetical protein [Prescottella equi]NKU01751.1 hypothetical protein [Prescottella equi]NKV36709.1 hypothetical protein [Prescottella equi]NKV37937.1 hypothetical protein [Prescottella equi]ORL33103.1 hypothetical protein A6I87_22680 [Prescottella equi]